MPPKQKQRQHKQCLLEQQKRRRVHFSERAICYAPSLGQASNEEEFPVDAFWYSQQQLENWRAQARQECCSLRNSYPVAGECMLSTHPSTRGLEQRACIERQRRRYLVIKFIVNKSRTILQKNDLAALTQRCTRYATHLAVEEASRDYDHVYGGQGRSCHGFTANNVAKVNMKRRYDVMSSSSRTIEHFPNNREMEDTIGVES